jgi:hypothetical protein
MTMSVDKEKEIIYFEQLISGLLLRFKSVDHLVLKTVSEEISKIKFVSFTYNDSGVKLLIDETSFGHSLKDEYIDENGNILTDIKVLLYSFTDSIVIDYLNKLNIEDLVIKKVADMEILTPADIKYRFNEEEQMCIKKLLDKGYLVNLLNDINNNEYMEIILSNLGKKKVFELEFPECIEEFKKLVFDYGYDEIIVDNFLCVQDYSKGIYEILNMDNFMYYCDSIGYSKSVTEDSYSLIKSSK